MVSLKRKVLSIITKLIVIISCTVGVILSAKQSPLAFMGGNVVFMYFTIQLNILIGLVCLIGLILLLLKKEANKVWFIIKFVSTISITLTGVVFAVVLAPTLGEYAWTLTSIFTHVVVPLFAIIDFFIIGVYSSIKYKEVFYVIIPPLLYAIYAGIGYILKWEFAPGQIYPYFFLNWGSKAGAFGFSDRLPYIGVVYWIILLLLFIIAIGFLYLYIIKLIKRRIEKSSN